MILRYENIPQFPAPPANSCNGRSVACAVCTCWNIGTAYDIQMPTLAVLGKSMGVRHRAAQPGSQHGICPALWCPFCVYLELRARGLAVGYGKLTVEQIRAHARQRHAMAMPGAYGRLPKVSPSSYSATVPARGRSDSYLGFHSMAVWFLDETDRYHLSDSDFGSAARPVIPPYSTIAAVDLEAYYLATGGWGICYAVTAPKAPPTPIPAVRFRFGGRRYKGMPGTYESIATANVRKGPKVLDGNITRRLVVGDRFEVAQSTYAGTKVGTTGLWHGNAPGSNWIHSSLLRKVA